MTHDTANPKDKIGRAKAPLSLFPVSAIKEGAMALFLGKTKYGRTNWRATPVYASIYIDAGLRHIYRWFEGNEVDPDDGTPELGNALACLAIVIDAKICGTLIDDRQFGGKAVAAYVNADLGVMTDIEAKYGHMKPKHYTITDKAPAKVESVTLNSGTVQDPAVILLASGQMLPCRNVPFSGGTLP